jgi:serine/threonine protein kinase
MIRSAEVKCRRKFPLRWQKCSIELRHNQLVVKGHNRVRMISLTAQTRVSYESKFWTKVIMIQSEGKKYYIKTAAADALSWVHDLRAEVFYDPNLCMDNFDCLSVLGRGCFGKVRLVRRKGTEQIFALKSIPKNPMIQTHRLHTIMSERAVLETISRTENPFLTQMKFAFQSATKFYLGLEYVPGGDLLGLLSRVGRVSLADAKLYIAEVGLALAAFHRNGIVYRDLKPENILIGADGHLKLADFGFAKQIDGGQTGSFCGTIDFMAPEVVLGKPYSYAVDWWALGVLGYQLIFGESPFYEPNREKMMSRIVRQRPNFPRDADSVAIEFLQKLLIKNPAQRFSFEGLKNHRFFEGMKMDDVLAKKFAPEFVPQLTSVTDPVYFGSEFTHGPNHDSVAELPLEDEPFPDFDFVAL